MASSVVIQYVTAHTLRRPRLRDPTVLANVSSMQVDYVGLRPTRADKVPHRNGNIIDMSPPTEGYMER